MEECRIRASHYGTEMEYKGGKGNSVRSDERGF